MGSIFSYVSDDLPEDKLYKPPPDRYPDSDYPDSDDELSKYDDELPPCPINGCEDREDRENSDEDNNYYYNFGKKVHRGKNFGKKQKSKKRSKKRKSKKKKISSKKGSKKRKSKKIPKK
jgi:hypothetical protein